MLLLTDWNIKNQHQMEKKNKIKTGCTAFTLLHESNSPHRPPKLREQSPSTSDSPDSIYCQSTVPTSLVAQRNDFEGYPIFVSEFSL